MFYAFRKTILIYTEFYKLVLHIWRKQVEQLTGELKKWSLYNKGNCRMEENMLKTVVTNLAAL